MENEWLQLMKENLHNYISTVDYKSNDFSFINYKKNIKSILGYEPAINIEWKTYEKINEWKKEAGDPNYITKIDEVEKVDIYIAIERNGVQVPQKITFVL